MPNFLKFSGAQEVSLAEGVRIRVCLRLIGAHFLLEMMIMETRIALIGIIVENRDCIGKLNNLLHLYGEHIIGRMGIPYAKKGVCVISVAMDAAEDTINTLSGKLGMLDGVKTKTIYSKF